MRCRQQGVGLCCVQHEVGAFHRDKSKSCVERQAAPHRLNAQTPCRALRFAFRNQSRNQNTPNITIAPFLCFVPVNRRGLQQAVSQGNPSAIHTAYSTYFDDSKNGLVAAIKARKLERDFVFRPIFPHLAEPRSLPVVAIEGVGVSGSQRFKADCHPPPRRIRNEIACVFILPRDGNAPRFWILDCVNAVAKTNTRYLTPKTYLLRVSI